MEDTVCMCDLKTWKSTRLLTLRIMPSYHTVIPFRKGGQGSQTGEQVTLVGCLSFSL